MLQDPLLQHAARLAAHPDFDAAIRAYTIGLARFREAPRFVNMIVSTDVRWRIVGFLVYLYADRERFGPEGGATYGRLLDLSTRQGDASPRALKSLLALLQVSGLVRVIRSQADRRLKIYQPTSRMDGFLVNWMRYATAALDTLEPEYARGRLAEDRAFIDAFSVSGGRAHLEDPIPLADRVPAPLSLLKAMRGSYSVVVAVLSASLDGTPTPSGHAMAKRFGLSRSQVGAIIKAGLAEGLFAADTLGGVTPTPSLKASFRYWISIELAFYSRHMLVPLEAVPFAAEGP